MELKCIAQRLHNTVKGIITYISKYIINFDMYIIRIGVRETGFVIHDIFTCRIRIKERPQFVIYLYS